ncbi:glycoside hydrolase [Corynespora cassiicola Philippines]|uniref:Probable glucan endo-1,3-beta-glucosidase eglC n=1 Tax=Corynespora cassiicola Philippines TaxID=1448308 RepID=A0A2T2NSU8_CORCC|nr:glycoside hydrolase [Corynespora cassiicola Philippines]
MRFGASILASTAILTGANAAFKGFNYGAFFLDQAPKKYVDFEYEFQAAKELPGTNGEFNSARLYTMMQWGTSSGQGNLAVIEAIEAAINTQTSLLLGLWTSAGTAAFNDEITCLKNAIDRYGQRFADLVVGISVGSEDLYRITPTGIQSNAGPGAQPNELVNYIQQTRDAIRGTVLAGKTIGHVDTWTAYVNASNNAVISALDWVGVDAYPYFQTTMENSIGNANATFYDALAQTKAASQGKPVWVTETGWPVSGDQQNQAVASAENAGIYWQDVSCSLMRDNVNLWYYTLQDAQMGTPSPSFGLKGAGDLKQVQPLFDLSCSAADPHNQLGNRYTAQITPVFSTLFVFDIGLQHRGKICTLTFHLPRPMPSHFLNPYKLLSPGGFAFSRLDSPAAAPASEARVSKSEPVGSVPMVMPGAFPLSSAPCEAGKTVTYRADALGELNLEFFQMTDPPVGLFVQVEK